jgi:hypothetical protein
MDDAVEHYPELRSDLIASVSDFQTPEFDISAATTAASELQSATSESGNDRSGPSATISSRWTPRSGWTLAGSSRKNAPILPADWPIRPPDGQFQASDGSFRQFSGEIRRSGNGLRPPFTGFRLRDSQNRCVEAGIRWLEAAIRRPEAAIRLQLASRRRVDRVLQRPNDGSPFQSCRRRRRTGRSLLARNGS